MILKIRKIVYGGKFMKKYRCKVCGIEFEVPDGEEPVCPVCGVSGEDLEEIE
jgi:rubredoxin